MSRFDEEPDGDPHGECAQEISNLTLKCYQLQCRARELIMLLRMHPITETAELVIADTERLFDTNPAANG